MAGAKSLRRGYREAKAILKRRLAYRLRKLANHLDKERMPAKILGIEEARIGDVLVYAYVVRGLDAENPVIGGTDAMREDSVVIGYKALE